MNRTILSTQEEKEAIIFYLHLLNHPEVQNAEIHKGNPICKICGKTAKDMIIDEANKQLEDMGRR